MYRFGNKAFIIDPQFLEAIKKLRVGIQELRSR